MMWEEMDGYWNYLTWRAETAVGAYQNSHKY